MRLMSRSERLLAHVRRLGLIALQLAAFSGASLLSSPASAQETNPPEETLTAPFDAADATSTGAFATSLPIKVPKARGPIPTLSITYNSQQGNGIAGMGWSMAGLPAVTRGRLNDGLRYDGLDGFFFVPGGWASTPGPEGQLIPVNKVTPTRTRYHTVSFSAGGAFNEFEPVGTCGSATSNVPCYWIMRDGSGTTYYFGGDEANNAGMYTPAIGFHAVMWEPDNGATQNRGILSWSLYKVVQTQNGITDSTDNYYTVTYENRSLLPDRIDYNLPAAGATPKSMRVTFEYSATARADITPMPQRFTKLLKNIRVFSNCPTSGSCSLVRRYQLDHTTSSISGNSLLTAFKEFGSDGDVGGTHLPAQIFTYTSLGGGGAAPQTTETAGAFLTFPGCSPTADPAHCRWTTLVGDINGDGRADVVRSYHGNQGDKVEYMLGGLPVGIAFGSDKTTHTNSPATTYTAPYFSTLADVNGDGKADLVRIDVHHSGIQNSIGYAVALGREPAAGDTNQSRLGDLYWQQPDSLSATGALVSDDWDNWRIVPADVNGDGYTDIALYDDSTRTLIVKISRGTGFTSGGQGNGQGFQYLTQQGVNAAVKRASNAWTLCAVGQGSFPPSHTFNGFFAADLNGDGRQDLIASWSGKEAPTGENERGKITVMTAMGGGAVIGTPTEYCEIHNVGQNAEVRWPYLAMRTGDINGDGRQDVLLNYQGRASMWSLGYRGVVNGRDLRNWLGTNGTVSAANVLHNHGRDQYTYPYASLSEGHLNQWEFHSRDINGDGIDDFIEFYAGQHGLTMNWGLGTPRGMDVTNSPAFTINGHPTNTSTPWEDGASYTSYRKWTSAMADMQGDGKVDLVRVRMGGSTSPSLQYIFGTTAGLSSTVAATSNLAGGFSGDSRYLVVRTADVNGDGRDDILIINNNGEQSNSAKIHVAESLPATSNAGVPDLLETIDNSMFGRTTVTYKHSSAMAAAIQPRSTSCGGASYITSVTGAACGRPNARPRALVYEINRNNGWGFSNRYRYNYVNGRVFGGNPLFRRDLGFQEIWKTDLNTNAYEVTHYRQEQPFQRRPSHVGRFRGDHTALSSDTYTYTQWDPYADRYNSYNSGLKAIGYDTRRHIVYESSSPGAAYAVSDRTYTHVWDWCLNLTEVRDSTTESGDTQMVTRYSYSNDEPNWLLGKELSMWKYRGSNILDMTRTTYGDAAKPLLATKHERVLFYDSAASTCASGVVEPWAGACADETSAGTAAKWVALFQNPSYDSYGNLTYGEAVPVMAFDNTTANHRKILGYDPNYMGLIASVTLATGDTASTTFDFAGRHLTTTDANNQPHTWTYDVYGRPTARREPGTSATSVRTWRYDGLTTFGYLFHDDNHASSSQTHRSDNYLDGFGELRQTTDYSGAGTITTLIQSAHAGNKLIRRRSLPTFSITPTAYLESAFDAKGRPEYVQRVNASFVQQKRFITYTYHTDGSISKTDAAGRTARTYLNQRGQTTRITDALGNNTYYYYNIALAPRQIVLPTGQTGNAVNVTYDSWGRLRTMDDPAAGFSTHEYNDAGSLLSVKRYTSSAKTTLTSQLSYGYDALERIATEGDPTVRASYYYAEAGRTNARGRLTRVVDLSGSTLLDYDVRGNVSRKEITLNGYTGSQVFTFTYNDRNMMTRKTFPGGSSDQYYYYTADGLLTSIVDSTSAVTYASYSQFTAKKQIGRLQSYYANSAYANTTTFGYDVDGQLTSKVLTRRDGTVLSDEAYTYDAVGNLLRTDDRRSGSKMVGPVNTDASQDYAYDVLNRLTFTCNNVVSGTCVGFGYDALGNMTSDSGESIAYYTTGSGAAQEKCVKSVTGATTNWIACHDTEGKRKRFEDYKSYLPSSASFYYTYDYKQRLTKVTKDGIDKEIYEYNYAGERTRKTYLDSTTNSWIRTWFVDPSFEIRNSDGSPTLFSKTFHEGSAAVRTYAPTITNQATTATVNASQYQRMSGSPIWANAQGNYVKHLDRLGSTYLMSKIPGSASDPSDGSELTRYWTDPWGIVRKVNSVGYDMTARKFGDRQYEDYSRLMYFGARYYHPLTRRFLTADDRIIRGATDAQGFHRFTYALNNPMRFVDPLGHDPKKPSWAASEPYGHEMPSSPSDERAAAAAAYASQFPAPPPQGPSLGPLDGQVMNTDHIAKVVSTLSDIADQGLRNFIHDKLKSEAAPVSVPRPGEAQGGNAASWNYGFQSTIVQSPGGFDPSQTGRGGIVGQTTLSDGTVIAGPYLPGEEMLKLTLRPASETLDPDRIMKEKKESEGKGSAPEFHDVHLAQWVMMDIATADSFQGAIENIANDIQMNPVGTIIPSVPGSGGGGAIPCPFYCGY